MNSSSRTKKSSAAKKIQRIVRNRTRKKKDAIRKIQKIIRGNRTRKSVTGKKVKKLSQTAKLKERVFNNSGSTVGWGSEASLLLRSVRELKKDKRLGINLSPIKEIVEKQKGKQLNIRATKLQNIMKNLMRRKKMQRDIALEWFSNTSDIKKAIDRNDTCYTKQKIKKNAIVRCIVNYLYKTEGDVDVLEFDRLLTTFKIFLVLSENRHYSYNKRLYRTIIKKKNLELILNLLSKKFLKTILYDIRIQIKYLLNGESEERDIMLENMDILKNSNNLSNQSNYLQSSLTHIPREWTLSDNSKRKHNMEEKKENEDSSSRMTADNITPESLKTTTKKELIEQALNILFPNKNKTIAQYKILNFIFGARGTRKKWKKETLDSLRVISSRELKKKDVNFWNDIIYKSNMRKLFKNFDKVQISLMIKINNEYSDYSDYTNDILDMVNEYNNTDYDKSHLNDRDWTGYIIFNREIFENYTNTGDNIEDLNDFINFAERIINNKFSDYISDMEINFEYDDETYESGTFIFDPEYGKLVPTFPDENINS